MKLIILPGLDGTGALVAPFCAAVAAPREAIALRYPDNLMDYASLQDWVLGQLPD